jgi:PadR family transcriptional regulator PadR
MLGVLAELDADVNICRFIDMERIRRPSRHTLELLAALTQRPRAWHYGYELSRITDLKSGTLYPILMRLSDRGILESKWRPAAEEGRPPRHMYRLTAAGVAFAHYALRGRHAAHGLTAPAEGHT